MTDKDLRQYLLATVVGICVAAGGCTLNRLYVRVDAVEKQVNEVAKDGAVIEQEIKNFRQSFEEFKRDVKDDIARRSDK